MDYEHQVELLAEAMRAVQIDLLNENSDLDKCGPTYLARRLLGELRAADGLMILPDKLKPPRLILPGPELDPEVSFIASAVAALDATDADVTPLAEGPRWRVLAYLASRYGFILATDD